MSEAILTIGHGSKFELGNADGPPETFTAIDGVTEISLSSNKIDTVDATELATPGTSRIFQSGLENPGDVTLKLNIRPGNTSQTSLKAAKNAGGLHNMKILAPSNEFSLTFAGIITGIDTSFPDDKKPTYSVKIQISGPVTETTPGV